MRPFLKTKAKRAGNVSSTPKAMSSNLSTVKKENMHNIVSEILSSVLGFALTSYNLRQSLQFSHL
jgi:hypothetical protein